MGTTTEVVSFRLPSEEHHELELRAQKLGIKVSELVRRIVRHHRDAVVYQSAVGITASAPTATMTSRSESLPAATTAAPLTQIPEYPPELVSIT